MPPLTDNASEVGCAYLTTTTVTRSALENRQIPFVELQDGGVYRGRVHRADVAFLLGAISGLFADDRVADLTEVAFSFVATKTTSHLVVVARLTER